MINYDRRGRGDSGDTAPYAVAREVEDLAALIDAAGGSAALYGHSSGAALALQATSAGLPVTHLVLHEPPYGEDSAESQEQARSFAASIVAFLDEGRPKEAVHLFLTSSGTPEAIAAEMTQDPAIVAGGHTLAYDFAILGQESGGVVPFDLVRAVSVPTLVLNGGQSPDSMLTTGKRIASALSAGRYHVFPAHGHVIPPRRTGRRRRAFSQFLSTLWLFSCARPGRPAGRGPA